MFLHVKSVENIRPFELELRFSDGTLKLVDLRNELYGEVFQPLQDPNVFKQVKLNTETGTIEWPNGADFAPEFLFKIGTEIKQVA